jgi:hypothetical protein
VVLVFERLFDQVGTAVALAARQAQSHELCPVRLQGNWPAIRHLGHAAEHVGHLEGQADHADLVGQLPVLDVVLFRVPVVSVE